MVRNAAERVGGAECLPGRVLGGSREVEGNEQRAVELSQGGWGKLASPAAESAGRQRADLLTEGD